ncbi:hypothetical protein [Microbacterium sp. NPDC089188]|uniref:hypothetical protein n=1 Tax=Microbacterium sp. NPDC089188 TaxID=3154971 RepID=UPI00341B4A17
MSALAPPSTWSAELSGGEGEMLLTVEITHAPDAACVTGCAIPAGPVDDLALTGGDVASIGLAIVLVLVGVSATARSWVRPSAAPRS